MVKQKNTALGIVFFINAILFGCSPSDPSKESTVEPVEWSEFCNIKCLREEMCFSKEKAKCLNKCLNNGEKYEQSIKPDFLASYSHCLESLSCEEIDDFCVLEGLIEVDRNFLKNDLVHSCLKKYSSCSSQNEYFDFVDDLCMTTSVLKEEKQQQAANVSIWTAAR